MKDALKNKDEKEIYELLAKIVETLVLLRNTTEIEDARDYILSSALLHFMNNPISLDKLKDKCREAENKRRMDRMYAFAYCIGLSTISLLTGKSSYLKLIEKFVDEFYTKGQIDTLFYATLSYELFLIGTNDYLNLKNKLKSNLEQYRVDWNNLDSERKVQYIYVLSVLLQEKLHTLLEGNKGDIHRIIEIYDGKYLSFLLKPLTISPDIELRTMLRPLILKKLRKQIENINKNEKKILAGIYTAILSGESCNNISVIGDENQISLTITLTPSDLAGITRKNIQTLSIAGLGLLSSGYNDCYILPEPENEQYTAYLNWNEKKNRRHFLVPKSKIELVCEELAKKEWWVKLGYNLILVSSWLILSLVLLYRDKFTGIVAGAGLVIFFIIQLLREEIRGYVTFKFLFMRQKFIEVIKQKCRDNLLGRIE